MQHAVPYGMTQRYIKYARQAGTVPGYHRSVSTDGTTQILRGVHTLTHVHNRSMHSGLKAYQKPKCVPW